MTRETRPSILWIFIDSLNSTNQAVCFKSRTNKQRRQNPALGKENSSMKDDIRRHSEQTDDLKRRFLTSCGNGRMTGVTGYDGTRGQWVKGGNLSVKTDGRDEIPQLSFQVKVVCLWIGINLSIYLYFKNCIYILNMEIYSIRFH